MTTQSIKQSWHFNKRLQHRLKRDILLKVAAQCFNEKGISGTSLKDVARKLGITDAALYYYVKNKEELVNLCYIRAIDLGAQVLDKAIADGNTCLERLKLYITYQIECVCGDEGPVAILSETPSLSPAHQDYIRSRTRLHTDRIVNLIRDGIEEGTIIAENPVISASAILGAVNWVPKWFKPTGPVSGPDIARLFAQTLTEGLRSR
jgi:AcrR family transcriptional regulator